MPGIDMSVDSYTRLFGVMGERLGDDWSPTIHNTIFAARADGAVFLPLRLPRDQISELMALEGSVFEGLNVAAPYNSLAASFMDKLIGPAAELELVDTISVDKTGARVGHLLLPEAIEDTLADNWVQCEDAEALIMGAGMFAECAARALINRGARVTFAARSETKAEALAARVERYSGVRPGVVAANATAQNAKFSILVNAMPIGTRVSDSAPAFSNELIQSCDAAVECVNFPVNTAFMDAAQSAGARVVSGFDIRLRAAELSQSAWGFKPLKRAIRMDVFGQLRQCAANSR